MNFSSWTLSKNSLAQNKEETKTCKTAKKKKKKPCDALRQGERKT